MPNDDADLKEQLAALRAENERLREFNDYLRAQRKQYLDAVCGPIDENAPTEDEMAVWMTDARPIDDVFAELGLTRPESNRS